MKNTAQYPNGQMRYSYDTDANDLIQGDVSMWDTDGTRQLHIFYVDNVPVFKDGYTPVWAMPDGKLACWYGDYPPSVTFDYTAPFIFQVIPTQNETIGILTQ